MLVDFLNYSRIGISVFYKSRINTTAACKNLCGLSFSLFCSLLIYSLFVCLTEFFLMLKSAIKLKSAFPLFSLLPLLSQHLACLFTSSYNTIRLPLMFQPLVAPSARSASSPWLAAGLLRLQPHRPLAPLPPPRLAGLLCLHACPYARAGHRSPRPTTAATPCAASPVPRSSSARRPRWSRRRPCRPSTAGCRLR
jgi:hypothetical protein